MVPRLGGCFRKCWRYARCDGLEQPNNSDFDRDLLIVKEKLGDLLIVEGKPADARKIYQEIAMTPAVGNPRDLDGVRDTQLIHERMADAYWQQGNRPEAKREFDSCAKMPSKVVFDPRNGLLRDEKMMR
jgi:hypothetical protein